jgi:hypothetical protein
LPPLPPLTLFQLLSLLPSALIAVAIALAALALALFVPTSLVSIAIAHIVAMPLLARHPCRHCSCRRCHHPLCCTTPLCDPVLAAFTVAVAVATATTDANVTTAVTVNAATTALIFTNVCLCFCHYPHPRFRMCHSHHDCYFCHSCCRFLVDFCLTHHYHCSANAFANAATSGCAFASHSPGWLSRGFSLRHNLLMRHRLSTHRLVVVFPLIVPPSHLPQLVVALPLVAPPLPLKALAAASRRVIASPCIGTSNFLLPFVKNTPPAPGRHFF